MSRKKAEHTVSSVKGARKVARSLSSLAKIQRPVGEASRYALQPMLVKAKQNLREPKPGRPNGNVITGELHDSMKIRQLKKNRAATETAVTATDKGVKKAHLVEFGTDPHWQPKRGVMHPGARPFPFLTPAFHDTEDETRKRLADRVIIAIEQQARRLSSK